METLSAEGLLDHRHCYRIAHVTTTPSLPQLDEVQEFQDTDVHCDPKPVWFVSSALNEAHRQASCHKVS